MRLIVEVCDGLVSAIYTDFDGDIDVDVIDRDCSEEDAEYYDHDYAEDMRRVSSEIENNQHLRPIW